MLKEITLNEALENYTNEDVLMSCKLNDIQLQFSLKDLLKSSKFYKRLDDKEMDKSITELAKSLASDPTPLDNDYLDEDELADDSIADELVEVLKESEEDSESDSIAEKYHLKHDSSNGVHMELDQSDKEYDSDSLLAEINKKKGTAIRVDLGKMYALKQAGWTHKQIALELRCSIGTVSRYINNKELQDEVYKLQHQSGR